MAKKEATPNMVEQFAEFKELKNIDKTTMISVLEESFRNVLAKMFGTDENLDVILNPDKGDVQIFQNLTVVPDGEVETPISRFRSPTPVKTTTPTLRWARNTLRKFSSRSSADALSSPCARPCSRRFSTSRKKPCMPSLKNSRASL